MKKIQLKLIDGRLGRDLPLPDYATAGSAGLDIRACIDEPLLLNPGDSALVLAGFAMHIGVRFWPPCYCRARGWGINMAWCWVIWSD